MRRSAVFAKIQIPVVIGGVKSEFVHSGKKHVLAFLSLAAADEFAYAGNEKVRRRDGFPVVVKAHIESLDFLRIIGEENGFFINLLGKISLVFALKVATPENGIFEFVFNRLEDLYRFGIRQSHKVARHNVRKPVDKPLIHEVVEKFEFGGTGFHNVRNNVLNHRFRNVHIVRKVGESHFRLDHPEFRGVTRRV